jgi:hypothetical protein
MHIVTVANVDGCFDCTKLVERLSETYEDDLRPYEICILGDSKGKRIQVRLDSGGMLGELSMDIPKGNITTTEELIRAVRDRIALMLDEVEP